MESSKRAIHIDFHTMPGIYDFGENFTADEVVEMFKKANVNYVNLPARCNIGFSYYNTKIGFPYPTMKNNLLVELLQKCKENDIKVVAYLNGGLNHEYMVRHPGIMKVNKDGSVYQGDYVKNNFFRSPCFHKGWGDYLIEEIKEILALEPDGIFCDCLIPRPCYCETCKKLMQEKGVDLDDDNEVYKFSFDTIKDIMRRIRDVVPKDKYLYLNSFPYSDIHDLVSHAELEALTAGFWGFDHVPTEAPYYRKFTNNRLYMSGCFVSDWGDFGGKKSKASIENDVFDALMYGYCPSIGDHMHPRDGLNKKLYENIGEIYSYVQKLEKWTFGKQPVTEVAVLRNKVRGYTDDLSFTTSDKSVARILSELKIQFDVVNEDLDFDNYKLLILPDKIKITDKLSEKLEKFKGSILSTGKSLKKGSIWDYIKEFKEDDNKTEGFYSYKGEVFGQYRCALKMTSDYSVSEYVEPYFKKEYDGSHGFFYVPADKSKGYSAVAKKGNKAHICFNIFEAYYDCGAIFLKDLVNDLIKDLLPDRLIISNLPSTSRVSLLKDEKETLLQIKTTYPEIRCGKGIIEEHTMLPKGKTISVLGEFKDVLTIPDMKKLEFNVSDGRTNITLPEINGYLPILLV